MKEQLEKLLKATDALLADMRERAIWRGDYEEEETLVPGGMGAKTKTKIATLDCGNSVLHQINNAREDARLALYGNTESKLTLWATPAGLEYAQRRADNVNIPLSTYPGGDHTVPVHFEVSEG